LICEVLPAESFLNDVLGSFCPRPIENSWEWICEHGRMPDGTPFDGDRIPWCRGVCEAWDDPATRELSLQWGTRLGKTTIGLQLIAKSAATKPMPGLFGTSTQSLAKRTVRNKIYPVLNNNRETRRLLPDERWWTVEEIRLSNSPWAVAWSGSDTQLADLSAYYGYANEIDKWSMAEKLEGEAGEGDPLDQFLERFKEFYDAKLLFECSPSTKRRSRIEKRLLASNNCRYHVPCPKCGASQPLRLGADDPMKGGILFDREPDGTITPEQARATARYVCRDCQYEIHDDQRPRMMRLGVWAPDGCGVDKRGRVIGTPKRGTRLWGSQLTSLYSLQLRWGDIAEKFVRTKGDARHFRMFVNGWLAETWEPYKSKSEPEQVGQKLATETPRGVIPKWATWLFAGVDKQLDHYVFWIVAFGPGEREHLVDHGTLDTLDEIETKVIRHQFAHEDGGEPLCPAMTFIDSGYRTRDVYVFCQKFRGTSHKVVPCKGANTDCAGEPYERKVIGLNEGQSARTKKALVRAGRGLIRIRVNPYYYEPITQEQIDERKPGEDGSLSLHADAREDLDLLKQLCNGAESEEPSKLDPNRHLWVKRWDNEPNDYRDAKRYARCAADYRFRRDWRKVENRQTSHGKAAVSRPMAVAAHEPATPRRNREPYRPTLGRRRGKE
jgi:phage terminase large subunit GpA-like protein